MTIDLNLDAGESDEALNNGSEQALYDLVTSINIACGGHAGNSITIAQALDLAKLRNINVGAHPSYPDLAGFGRVAMNLKHEVLVSSLVGQIERLLKFCVEKGVKLSHVKPHGALYNKAADDKSTAMAIIESVQRVDRHLKIIGLAGTPFKQWCEDAGSPFIGEGFPDRRYEPNGRLRSRNSPDALITNPEDAANQALNLVTGKFKDEIDTLCIHGDAAGAVKTAAAIRKKLESSGVIIAPFCGHSPRPPSL